MSRTKAERRMRKRLSQIFRDVGNQGREQCRIEHLKAGRRYGRTINLPLGKSPSKAKTYYRVPGMKPLLHNGGKPR